MFINSFIDKIRNKLLIKNLKFEVKTLQKNLQIQEQNHIETTTDLRQTIKILQKDYEKLEIYAKNEYEGKEKLELNISSQQRNIKQMERRIEYYNNFIRHQLQLTYNRDKPQLDTNKYQIMLDTSVILDPINQEKIPVNHKHLPLLKLLKFIDQHDDKLQPIISNTLWKEINYAIENHIEDMTIFPALELSQYLRNCCQINEASDKNKRIVLKQQEILTSLTLEEKEKLSKSTEQNMINDLLFIAIAKNYDSIFITEDYYLVNYIQSKNLNLKILTLRPPKTGTNFKDLSYEKHLSKLIL